MPFWVQYVNRGGGSGDSQQDQAIKLSLLKHIRCCLYKFDATPI